MPEGEMAAGARSPRRAAAIGLALAVFSALFFLPVVGTEVINFDTPRILLAEGRLYATDSFWSGARRIFTLLPREEPLFVRDLTWLLEAQLFGFGKPAVHQLGNVLLNAANVVLLFALARAWGERALVAGLGALLWAVLPIRVEPVAWIMGRKDLLAAFFVLVALLVQARSWARHGRTKSSSAVVIAGLIVLGCFSKISAIAAGPALAALEVLRPGLGPRRPNARSVAHMGLWNVACLASYLGYRHIVESFGRVLAMGPSPLAPGHLLELTRVAPVLFVRYWQASFSSIEHSCYYEWPNIHYPVGSARYALSLAFLITLAFVARWAWSRAPRLLAYLAAGALLIGPYLGFQYVAFVFADRYAYLPSGFWALALVAAGAALFDAAQHRLPRAPRWGAVLLGGLVLVQGVSAYRLQDRWQSSSNLWFAEVEVSRPSIRAFATLAALYVQEIESRPEAERARLLKEAEAVVTRGLEVYRARDPQPVEGYLMAEKIERARLLLHRAHLARLAKRPPELRLRYFTEAHQAFPFFRTAMGLSRAWLDLAEAAETPEARQHAEARVFEPWTEETLASVRRDPIELRTMRAWLVELAEANPALEPQIRALRANLE